jgi:acyl-[acyl carrier protein]--UDP-N-acetylglucosamine O-acyltransferase
MIIENDKPIKIIGYSQSSLTDGALRWFSLESKNEIEIITPELFLDLKNKSEYQYFVGFSLDMNLRKVICDEIDQLDLDCVTYIHDSCVLFDNCKIGKGVFVGAFSTITYHSEIENHCWIECYCLLPHHGKIGKGSVIHGGTLLAGRTTIGEYCTFGFKSSMINHVTMTNNVTIGAFSNVTKNITKPGRYVGSIARYVGE